MHGRDLRFGISAVRALIDKVAPEIAVAAMNGPLNTGVSGDRSALRMLLDELNRQHISYRELYVSNAFHSPFTEPILDDLQNVASQITYHPPEVAPGLQPYRRRGGRARRNLLAPAPRGRMRSVTECLRLLRSVAGPVSRSVPTRYCCRLHKLASEQGASRRTGLRH